MKKRIEYIDIAKGILILFVMFGHLYKISLINFQEVRNLVPIYYNIREWIYTFHIPAFFIITGILLDANKISELSFKQFLKKKVKSLLIPYIILEMVAAIVQMFIYGTNNITFKSAIYSLITLKNPTVVNWFLLALFFSEVLFWFCIKIKKQICLIGLIIVNLLATHLFSDFGYYMNFICRILVGTSFIIIGNLIKRNNINFGNKKFLVGSAIISLISLLWSNNIDLYYCNIGNPIIYIIASISGSLLILSVSKLIDIPILKYFGRNSLIILGTHQLIINTIARFNNYVLSYTTMIYALMIIIILELLIIEIIKKLKHFYENNIKERMIY